MGSKKPQIKKYYNYRLSNGKLFFIANTQLWQRCEKDIYLPC